ncbi:hypothetical protein OUZ56_013558 [Daphnia magna]|uniref:Uncharacterized protein n=1 Tax=Daphnia magna TaxID=35525 RepID=A0ABQ9Z695_9CRUS|nr:hypothetical protein OUZ56_013558 [Daphnia magna]
MTSVYCNMASGSTSLLEADLRLSTIIQQLSTLEHSFQASVVIIKVSMVATDKDYTSVLTHYTGLSFVLQLASSYCALHPAKAFDV